MMANKVISSAADDWVINPFGKRWALYCGLCDFDFVFLQHGLVQHDLSDWLYAFRKNIALLDTCSPKEQELIVSREYGYTTDTVKLLGMPRHDRLTNGRSKTLVVMPSWRQSLVGSIDPQTSTYGYNKAFVSSAYYRYWQSLLNNKTLIAALHDSGYTLRFFLHPALEAQINDFSSSDPRVIIEQYPYDYASALSASALLLTDYSSLYYEHAYLRKPVIASFFDYQEVTADTHTYELNPENYNLGPVVYTLEDTVDLLRGYLLSDCPLNPPYEQKMNELFAFHDRNNSKRVYEAITEMEKATIVTQKETAQTKASWPKKDR
jgi:CDP-glycerol glycerophosphotransferase (TagB/SpsB family)